MDDENKSPDKKIASEERDDEESAEKIEEKQNVVDVSNGESSENNEKTETEDDPTEDDEDESDESNEDYPTFLRYFMRPEESGTSHSLLSSPFVRKLVVAAASRNKPPWYRTPDSTQFALFKTLFTIVEAGRTRQIKLALLVRVLEEMAPTINTEEVISILERTDRGSNVELDFGEFLFLLANNPTYDEKLRAPNFQRYMYKKDFNPRQRLLYSAAVFYAILLTPFDIESHYTQKTTQHVDVLRYHMVATRNQGLSELEMEKRQMDARAISISYRSEQFKPYITPMPFIRATCHEPYYMHYKKRKDEWDKKLAHSAVKPQTVTSRSRRQLGSSFGFETEEERLIYQFEVARLPRPDMRVPRDRLIQMRTRVSEADKVYLKELKEKAMEEYYARLKLASVLFSKQTRNRQLSKGFPDADAKNGFITMLKRLMPMSVNQSFIMHPWTQTGLAVGALQKHRTKVCSKTTQ